jgi:peptidyl-prolyl cis-trans isomerase SurA
MLEKIFNKDQPLALQIEEGPFERGSRPILEEIPWEAGSYTIKKDDRVYYLEVNKVLPAALKELNEVRGLVISDYQNYLEKDWIQSLKNKYTVQVNEDSLEKVYQKFENN